MYLVNEKHIIFLKRCQYACQIAGFVEHRSGCHFHAYTQLIGDDAAECGFAETGRTVQQCMVQSLSSHTGGLDEYFQIFYNFFLTTECTEQRGAERLLEVAFRVGVRPAGF